VELIELIKRRWRVFFRIDISNNKLLSDLRKLDSFVDEKCYRCGLVLTKVANDSWTVVLILPTLKKPELAEATRY